MRDRGPNAVVMDVPGSCTDREWTLVVALLSKHLDMPECSISNPIHCDAFLYFSLSLCRYYYPIQLG